MKKIRLSKSCLGMEEQRAVCRVLEQEFLGMGAEVQLFERELAGYLDTEREVICANTGTSALHLALACLDIGPGDEVLVPSITYVASFQAISATGAKAVACDVRASDAFIDIEDAKKRLTPKTRAIMPVHYASSGRAMDDVYRLAEAHGLRVIEDAAHAFGCMVHGTKVGATGDVVCFSFDGIKNITSGEGGAVVTGDAALAARIKDARLLGVEKDTEKRYIGERSWEFNVSHQGFRYHMSNIMAAVGREQLKKIGRFADIRCRCVEKYRELLADVESIRMLEVNGEGIIPHIFVVRVLGGQRDQLMGELRKRGVECGIHYQPNHYLSLYQTNEKLPVTEQLGNELLSLPLHADLTEDDVVYVVEQIREVLGAF